MTITQTHIFEHPFEFAMANLMAGSDHLSRRAQAAMTARGPGKHTGLLRAHINKDRTARCEVTLHHDGEPVYTAHHETGPLISPAGSSRVTDVTNSARWLLAALFERPTPEMLDTKALTAWAYEATFGKPM